jgi:hypothetical protein
MSRSPTSALVAEYRRSPFSVIWQKLWKVCPGFSAKHSPFFLFEDGSVLWNQGFGKIAYLKGDRSLTIQWSFEGVWPAARVLYLSSVRQWDPPHENDRLSQTDVVKLRERLINRFLARGENIAFR